MQEYTRKKAKEAKNHTQALRELKYSYTQKNDFSLELNPGGGGLLPYKDLMGRAASQGMFFGIFVVNRVSNLSFFALIRVSIYKFLS